HRLMCKNTVSPVQHEGGGSRRLAQFLYKDRKGPGGDRESYEPQVHVSFSNRDAIVQRSRLCPLAIDRRSPIGVFAEPYLIGNLRKLAVSCDLRMAQLRRRVVRAAHDAQRLAGGTGVDKPAEPGPRGLGAR